jgi:hypothetical protein
MKERAKELKAEERPRKDKAAGESDVLAKIAEMPEMDRSIFEWPETIIKASAPDLMPKTWYGMPSYSRDSKVVCFFQEGFTYRFSSAPYLPLCPWYHLTSLSVLSSTSYCHPDTCYPSSRTAVINPCVLSPKGRV